MEMKQLLQLKKEAEQNSWAHAYLFISRDQEKVFSLIDFIKTENKILDQDISTVEPEEESGKKGEIKISQIKELLHSINLTPSGPLRLAIVKNCEKLNQSSANILLKTLEEPPRKAMIVLTAQNNSVISTIRSRCRIYQIPALPDNQSIGKEASDFFQFTTLAEAEKIIDFIVKEEQVEKFLNELVVLVRGELLNSKSKNFIELLHLIHQIKNDIKNNASSKLAMECLWFKGRKAYDRKKWRIVLEGCKRW